eukprot:CAMPEP_0178458986 /NCGR_PEP_ID=MMETSP0689_2-20121128/47857_1 /TAXON_ID=160604 /ORGANISM="Amphidinium massartii, Strain CS-259" /LENGTH=111 /DNA_ID=CAMNT_0020085369 /DNA_START=265 /DNA_END=600 /DNA_ORIENTATION=+
MTAASWWGYLEMYLESVTRKQLSAEKHPDAGSSLLADQQQPDGHGAMVGDCCPSPTQQKLPLLQLCLHSTGAAAHTLERWQAAQRMRGCECADTKAAGVAVAAVLGSLLSI